MLLLQQISFSDIIIHTYSTKIVNVIVKCHKKLVTSYKKTTKKSYKKTTHNCNIVWVKLEKI